MPRTKLRFHFVSDWAGSDRDGLWSSHGAAIVDSITITVTDTLVDFEDFEAAALGDSLFDGDGNGFEWSAESSCCAGLGWQFGVYSGLSSNLEDHDPCGENLSTQVVFFHYSPFPSVHYPGLYDTPFCSPYLEWEQCHNEMITSPVLDLAKYSTAGDENQDADIPPGDLAELGGIELRFTVYRDLPLENLVFYYWHVRDIEDGCSMNWKDRDILYYGDEASYFAEAHDISDLVTGDSIQIGLGIVDMCDYWYGIYGDCSEHTPAPWFDNISIHRYKTIGPQWSYRDMDLFQDNFPSDENDMESFVRADMAADINALDNPVIRPGDSIVVSCASPVGGGIAEDAFGPRVYMHTRVTHLGPDAKTPPSGAVLEGDYGRYAGMNGAWTVIQGDTAGTGDIGNAPGMYMFDLNDSLFTRGFMIEYYFEAYDNYAQRSTLPASAHTLPDEAHYRGSSSFFEFTCLPTLYSDMLYVDDYHGRGTRDGTVQHYFETSFKAVVWDFNYPDRYDVNAPTSLVSNGPGSRAKHAHLAETYDFIIWDSGDLSKGTICDGTTNSDKSNDCRMLIDWLSLTSGDRTLWILGDNIAADLDQLVSGDAVELMGNWCGVSLQHDSYYRLTGGYAGGDTSPEVSGVPQDEITLFPSFCVAGTCPPVKNYDVLTATFEGQYALEYPEYDGTDYYAAVQSMHLLDGYKQTMWFGFSFMNIQDCELPGEFVPTVRHGVLNNMIYWHCKGVGCTPLDITEAEVPVANSLAQNFPNPFNPVTTIRYSVRSKGPVSLKIYNAAGQLIRVLVDEVRDPGAYTIDWDGRNDRGSKVTSGVYFYCMEAKDYRRTKKMVMLR